MRKYRELEPETKRKISASTKGKKKTKQHRDRIARAMVKYWQGVPNKPLTMDEFLGIGRNTK